jgi:hypothetical protein
MEEWQRARHYRNPLIQQFEEAPYVVCPNDSLGNVYPSVEVLKAMSAIKVIMTWPGSSYNATISAEVLADLHPVALKEALDLLVNHGFLTRSSRGRNRYRVPGTPYSLSHRCVAFLLSDSSTTPQQVDAVLDSATMKSFDFNLFLDAVIDGHVKSELGHDGEQMVVKLVGLFKDPLDLNEADLSELMQQNGLWSDNLARTWFWPTAQPLGTPDSPSWRFHVDLFKNALRAVRLTIDQEPGILLESIHFTFWPILDRAEIADLLACLQSLGLAIHIDDRYYPSIVL